MTIPPWAITAVLAGAALHAAWNVAIRGGADRRSATIGLILGGAVIAGATLPFLPQPRAAAWPHLLATALLHIVYFNLVGEAYARGAVSLIYPVMRGTAPALTALIATIFLGETLGGAGWCGLLLISAGVGLLARRRGEAGEGRALVLALANAIIIALYTANDGVGVRLSEAPLAYALWTFVLPAIPAILILARFSPTRLRAALKPGPLLRGFGGGACSIASYALALWAMTQAPIGAIAALRETALLFGVLFAWWFLHERPGSRGLTAIAIIAAGATVLRLG